jgi:mono/diheme cytochrome c family protein
MARRLTAVLVTMIAAVTAGGCATRDDAADHPDGLGAGVYQQSCASCHGADHRGTATGPSLLSIVYEPAHHSDESFRAAITGGSPQHHWSFGPMPAVGGMSDADIEAVIRHVRDQQDEHGFEPYPPD